MKYPLKIIVITALVAGTGLAVGAANLTAIIPAPMKAEGLPGQFQLTAASAIVADGELRNEAELLAARLQPATRFELKIKSAGALSASGDIVLTTNGADVSLGAEGYELSVTTNGVVIRAPAAAGIFYGTQSLLQLLPPEIFSAKSAGGIAWTIPCVKISDAPRVAWRGFMLDVSRHFFTKAEVEKVLDLLALYKLNTFHWHLVDDQGWRIQIKKYPKLTSIGAWRKSIGFGLDPKSATAYDSRGRYGGFYTQRDIREVVAYAAARHITVVPEIEMPGHSMAALAAYPQFSCTGGQFSTDQNGGVFHGIYDVSNEGTYVFLGDILHEVAGLFPGTFIHIGGDEVPKETWHNSSACQALMKAEGLKNEKELQAFFTRRIEKIVNADGKRIIGWSEIREGGLTPSAALMDWIGGGQESAESGHDVVMTPTKYCYFDHCQSTNRAAEPTAIGWNEAQSKAPFLLLKTVYEFDPLPEKLAPEFRTNVLGGQANLWTEYVPNLRRVEYMMLPRLEALSEADWSTKEARDWSNFEVRAALNEQRLAALGVNYRSRFKPD
jgi:hexosaminidase